KSLRKANRCERLKKSLCKANRYERLKKSLCKANRYERLKKSLRTSTDPREGPEEEEEAPAEDAGGASRIGEGEGIVVEEAGDEKSLR
ncbi:hypothetical protein Taro_002751, partial [Colocasia esculenta]|nr:hypothetical protein [Colocasia esculenta]